MATLGKTGHLLFMPSIWYFWSQNNGLKTIFLSVILSCMYEYINYILHIFEKMNFELMSMS